jgi:hypothetical protein
MSASSTHNTHKSQTKSAMKSLKSMTLISSLAAVLLVATGAGNTVNTTSCNSESALFSTTNAPGFLEASGLQLGVKMEDLETVEGAFNYLALEDFSGTALEELPLGNFVPNVSPLGRLRPDPQDEPFRNISRLRPIPQFVDESNRQLNKENLGGQKKKKKNAKNARLAFPPNNNMQLVHFR